MAFFEQRERVVRVQVHASAVRAWVHKYYVCQIQCAFIGIRQFQVGVKSSRSVSLGKWTSGRHTTIVSTLPFTEKLPGLPILGSELMMASLSTGLLVDLVLPHQQDII